MHLDEVYAGKEAQQHGRDAAEGQQRGGFSLSTSLRAHIRAMEPMLLVMVIRVAFARSSLLTDSRFSLLIMFPKLQRKARGQRPG